MRVSPVSSQVELTLASPPRNDIPLPDQLPICLRPSNLRHSVIDRHNKVMSSHRTRITQHLSAVQDLYAGGKAQEPLLQEERLPEDVRSEKEKVGVLRGILPSN